MKRQQILLRVMLSILFIASIFTQAQISPKAKEHFLKGESLYKKGIQSKKRIHLKYPTKYSKKKAITYLTQSSNHFKASKIYLKSRRKVDRKYISKANDYLKNISKQIAYVNSLKTHSQRKAANDKFLKNKVSNYVKGTSKPTTPNKQPNNQYNYNRKTNVLTKYYGNGALKETGKIKNGIPYGYWKIYHKNGKLHQAGNFSKGKRIGTWVTYNTQGKLTSTTTYK